MPDRLLLAVNAWMTGAPVLAVLGCFLWGGVSILFSPCHLASIPLLVGYVAGQGGLVAGWLAVRYALAFCVGLFVTIAVVGALCTLLGRLLGDVGPYLPLAVGAVLLWVGLDMLGVFRSGLSCGVLGRLRARGLGGALLLGLVYGVLSGTCTFGFLAPILAILTIQGDVPVGLTCITAFAAGHCLPLVAAGACASPVQSWLDHRALRLGAPWLRQGAGGLVALFGLYWLVSPFWSP
jgi:cytochrome c-type biogenesis protein